MTKNNDNYRVDAPGPGPQTWVKRGKPADEVRALLHGQVSPKFLPQFEEALELIGRIAAIYPVSEVLSSTEPTMKGRSLDIAFQELVDDASQRGGAYRMLVKTGDQFEHLQNAYKRVVYQMLSEDTIELDCTKAEADITKRAAYEFYPDRAIGKTWDVDDRTLGTGAIAPSAAKDPLVRGITDPFDLPEETVDYREPFEFRM